MDGGSGGPPAGGAGDHIEVERKFDVGPDFVMPDLTGVPGVADVGEPRTHRLSAVYYDTPGLHLAAARITLRRRTGGADAGWHVKLPAGAEARREVHAPLGDAGEDVPARLAALLAGRTGGQPLRPIARLETTRRLRLVTGQAGEVLAEIADDLVTGALASPAAAAGPGPAEPGAAAPGAGNEPARWRESARWREVEVELRAGRTNLLDALGERLGSAGARPSAAGSKLARLLTSAGATAADRGDGDPGPRTT